jgi:hypothetical protein
MGTFMAEEKLKKSEINISALTSAAMGPLGDLWRVDITVLGEGLVGLWARNGKLRAVACPGIDGRAVQVPVTLWANLRLLSDRLKVPATVVVVGEGSVLYANWPPAGGLDYACRKDPVSGAVIEIPRGEFKEAKAPTAT